MLNIVPALVACIIWSLSIVYYKKFTRKIPVIKVNLVRLFGSSIALLATCALIGCLMMSSGLIYAVLSGVLALAIGDTLYIYSSSIIGVSAAAPIAYLYVILVQFLALMFGEELTIGKIIASILAVVSILLIATVREEVEYGKMKIIGIVLAFATCMAWSFGQVVLKPATLYVNPLEITLVRSLSGFTTLLILYPLISNVRASKKEVECSQYGNFRSLVYVYIAILIIGILDLALGSYLFVYSIATIGVGYTVIITGTIPVLAQIFANIIEREKLNLRYITSGLLVATSIIITTLS